MPNWDYNQPAHLQSDQSLRCPHEETLYHWLSETRTVKILIRLRECAVWSESSLGAHVQRYVFWHYGSNVPVKEKRGTEIWSKSEYFIHIVGTWPYAPCWQRSQFDQGIFSSPLMESTDTVEYINDQKKAAPMRGLIWTFAFRIILSVQHLSESVFSFFFFFLVCAFFVLLALYAKEVNMLN